MDARRRSLLTIYLDTSLLVSAMTTEPRSAESTRWLADHEDAGLVISDWVIAEFSSAVAVKQRRGDVGAADGAEARAMFATLVASVFDVVPVTRPQFRSAARLAEAVDTGLRASGALHIAIALDLGLALVTLDRGMARAATLAGVRIA